MSSVIADISRHNTRGCSAWPEHRGRRCALECRIRGTLDGDDVPQLRFVPIIYIMSTNLLHIASDESLPDLVVCPVSLYLAGFAHDQAVFGVSSLSQ